MRSVIYSMGGVSLDGYIAGPDGGFDWGDPDEELHRFHNERVRELGLHVLGRRLHEVMRYWETVDESELANDVEREFAGIWNRLPKLVASRTLESVEGDSTLIAGDVADEVARLKREPGGDIAVGGADLAATLIERDLVDEYGSIIHPVIVGGGTPFLPAHARQLDLELVETRTFASGPVYLRHRRVRDS